GGAMSVGQTPVMVSLHATKIAGIGEGGLVLTQNENLMSAMRACIQFGFEGERLSHRVGMNAKASEYDAAVGLAMLDVWQDTRQAWSSIRKRYMDSFSDAGIRYFPHYDCVSSVFNVIIPQAALTTATSLRKLGIDSRRWWEAGCHVHPAYRAYRKNALPVTEWLGESVLGIPMAMDISPNDQDAVCDAVIRIAMHVANAREYA
ncbi:MAG: DegT/DnrJ/EryC1/StrS family aminotransferase, partial [Rickettsiales bacterium]|nr:DegT/DnrJ/EryC1/StrS family aminotransferase [Rickettsiales bacterium]